MRLIDADQFDIVALKGVTDDYADGVKHMLLQIDNAPTIEAEPVRHGRWLTWEEMFYGDKRASNNIGVFCSMCEKHSDNMTNYCPECGAEMDGGDEDGEC